MNAVKQWVAGAQIQGGRDYQEDDFSIRLLTDGDTPSVDDRLLLVLADGMGGHAGGAEASRTVVQAFQDAFHHAADSLEDRFNAGITAANDSVKEKQQADPNLSEMGSTMVAAVVIGASLYWVSVGDSLLWVFRDGRLRRLNADHSMRPLLQDLVELGRMTEEEAQSDPRANQLRSVIFGDVIPLIDMNADGFALEDGDTVVLASDGLETLPEDALVEAVKAGGSDAEAIVIALLDGVSAAGRPGQDNTTVIVYRVGGSHETTLRTELCADAPGQPLHAAQEDKSATTDENMPEAESKSSVKGPGLLGKVRDVFTGNRGEE